MGERELQVGRVQRFCLRDGPGIRTILFLQGCPLGCWWCQNPDLREQGHRAGRSIRVDELSRQLLRDLRYWRSSGGGVTVSGGEPLVQAEPLAELLHLLATQGVDRCVESSLGVDGGTLGTLLPQVDRWLLDLKHADAEVLHRVVGIDLGVYRSNLHRVLDACGAVQLRIALIRSFNDSPRELSVLGEFLADLPAAVPVRILPGHDLGRLDKPQAAVTPEACRQARDILSRYAADVEVLW